MEEETMPRHNGRGPGGTGPGTGRGMGYCSGSAGAPYVNAPGRGNGRGNGFCRRFGQGFGQDIGQGRGAFCREQAPLTPAQEKELLNAQARELEERLQEVKEQLNSFETETDQ